MDEEIIYSHGDNESYLIELSGLFCTHRGRKVYVRLEWNGFISTCTYELAERIENLLLSGDTFDINQFFIDHKGLARFFELSYFPFDKSWKARFKGTGILQGQELSKILSEKEIKI